MELREHQTLAIEMARQSIRDGRKRPIIAAPTSFGKTVLAAQMMKNCQNAGKQGWFFCDRLQLIEQAIEKFDLFGIEFGVHQAGHERLDPTKPIQIASIQTIQAMVGKHKRSLPAFDFAMVDECHTNWEIINRFITEYNNIPIIGLTATPYSTGLGAKYNNLLVPITPRELLDKGYLTPVRYYGGEHIDMSKIRSNNVNAYRQEDIEAATERENDRLAGCIIKNWFKYGEDSQTIAFSPTQNLSKSLVERFNENGISAEHIDCHFSQDDREALFEAHDAGEFKVLSCSQLLNTGYDAPSVKCIIDCYPVKSISTYVQRVGRIMRTHDTKDHAIYLDHASNFERFGYAEDIVPEMLCDGTKTKSESELTKDNKKEPVTRECPQCMQQMAGRVCKACGYEMPIVEVVEDDGSMLVEITVGNTANKKDGIDLKAQFLAELRLYGKLKGYKDGWANYQYKTKYDVWPDNIPTSNVKVVGDLVNNWIKHQAIKKAKSKKKGETTLQQLRESLT